MDTSVYTTNWASRVAVILGTKNPASPGQLTIIQGYDSQVKAAEHILKNPNVSPAQKEAATNEIAAMQKAKAAYEKQIGATKQQLIDELKLVSRTVLPFQNRGAGRPVQYHGGIRG